MQRNRITLLIVLALVIVAAVIVFPLSSSQGGWLFNRPVKLGVDLNGGTSIIYAADVSKIAVADQSSAKDADVTAIRSRVDALGVTEPIIDRLGSDRIRVVLPGVKNIEEAKAAIGGTALAGFGVQATDPKDPAIKWPENAALNVVGNWMPATGTVNGQALALTSAYFKQNTALGTDQYNNVTLDFQWDSTGSQLSEQITTKLVNGNQPLGIFGADGRLVSDPRVQAVITTNGQITGLSVQEATQLKDLLNAGRLSVPLTPGTETTVGTALGDQFVGKTLKAAIIGLI